MTKSMLHPHYDLNFENQAKRDFFQALATKNQSVIELCLKSGIDFDNIIKLEAKPQISAMFLPKMKTYHFQWADAAGAVGLSGALLDLVTEKMNSGKKAAFCKQALATLMVHEIENAPRTAYQIHEISKDGFNVLFKRHTPKDTETAVKHYVDVILKDLRTIDVTDVEQCKSKTPSLQSLSSHLKEAKRLLSSSKTVFNAQDVTTFFRRVIENPKAAKDVKEIEHLLVLSLEKLGRDLECNPIQIILNEQTQTKVYQPIILELKKNALGYLIAAGQLNAQSIKELISSQNVSLRDAGPWNRFLPLAMALKRKDFKLAEVLVASGAKMDVLAYSDVFSEPVPLIVACAVSCNKEAVEWLIQNDKTSNHQKSLNARYAAPGVMSSNQPLALAGLNGDLDMVKLMLGLGVSAKVLNVGQQRVIEESHPEIARLLQFHGPLQGFSYLIKRLTIDGLGLKNTPLSLTANASSDRLDNDRLNEAAKNTSPSVESTEGASGVLSGSEVLNSWIHWIPVSSLLEQVKCPEKLANQKEKVVAFAKEISVDRGDNILPLLPDDKVQLKRLWEHSIPLMIKQSLSIPPDHRAMRFENQPSVWEKLEELFESTHQTMKIMQQRAIVQAHRRMDVEMAVVLDKQNGAANRFTELVEQVEAKSLEPSKEALHHNADPSKLSH